MIIFNLKKMKLQEVVASIISRIKILDPNNSRTKIII